MASKIPRKFGKCTLARRLGKGATAVVYLARHDGLGIPVAVKILRRSLSQSRPDYATRFLREARMAAWLDHPNIVRVIDCGIQEGYHYMVMDYVDGPNCLQKLEDQPDGIEWREATDIVRQAATGLAYAAERDVIHRDVKPSNIMIDSTGRARVTDLGLAKLTVKGMEKLTQELQTVGTPNYMSPEQIRSPSGLDLRADIYSLGATYYHMVTGRPPFLGDNNMGVIAQHLTSQVEPPYHHRTGLPAPLSSLICKMMAKSPDERYQDYESVIEELDRLLQGDKVKAEDFEETHLSEEEDRRLAEMLLQLEHEDREQGEKPDFEVPDLEDLDAAEQEPEPPQTHPSAIDVFAPEELSGYSPPGPPEGDELMPLAESTGPNPLLFVLLVAVLLGILFVVAVTVYSFLAA